MFSETSKCLNCPSRIARSTDKPNWHHVGEYEGRHCQNPYLAERDLLGTNIAKPDEYSQYVGRAVIVSAGSMAYYGVLRALSPGALVVVPRDSVPVPVVRGDVTNVREIPEPEKVGLRHDKAS